MRHESETVLRPSRDHRSRLLSFNNHQGSQIMRTSLCLVLGTVIGLAAFAPARAADNSPPPGFTALFNGEDLTGWKGLLKPPLDNPSIRAKLTPEQLADAQKEADKAMRRGWRVQNGELVFNGHGRSLCTAKDYGDFELYVDWKISPHGDSGIYLRGCPQVQIWDPFTKPTKSGSEVGSGGLYNNLNPKTPPNRRRWPTNPSANGTPSTSRWSATG